MNTTQRMKFFLPATLFVKEKSFTPHLLSPINGKPKFTMEAILLVFILVLSIFLGFELISKVPATLHTPLMSGSNAISGITVVGALLTTIAATNSSDSEMKIILGVLAVAFATTNVVGGYLVTDRMLRMFKKKEPRK